MPCIMMSEGVESPLAIAVPKINTKEITSTQMRWHFARQEPLWLIIPQYCHSHHLVSSLAQLLLRHIPRINLFNNDHFSRLYIGIINFQGIEIETTCNGFTIVISSVPIGRFCPMRVDTRQAVSQFN